MSEILKGLTVVDLTQNVAGPFCTQLLGDYGAHVIKLERPDSGDDTRGWRRHMLHGISTSYLAVNRNKKSVGLDIGGPAGTEVIRRLVRKADVFIHSVRPGSLEARGLGYADLKADNPSLVHCAISAFGDAGPRVADPGYDALLQAYCGIMSVTGHPDRPPARAGVSLIDFGTGMWAFMGILAALYRRKDTGQGAEVTTSLMETGVSFMTLFMSHYLAEGVVLGRTGDMTQFAAPYESFKTRDGAVLLVAANDSLFVKTCKALGVPELLADPRFSTMDRRADPANRGDLHAALEAKTLQLSTLECEALMRKTGAPCSPINSVDAVCRDEQVNAMRMIRPMGAPHIPDFRTVDLPVSIDGRKALLREPPPALGADTDEVLRWAGYGGEEIAALRASKTVA